MGTIVFSGGELGVGFVPVMITFRHIKNPALRKSVSYMAGYMTTFLSLKPIIPLVLLSPLFLTLAVDEWLPADDGLVKRGGPGVRAGRRGGAAL